MIEEQVEEQYEGPSSDRRYHDEEKEDRYPLAMRAMIAGTIASGVALVSVLAHAAQAGAGSDPMWRGVATTLLVLISPIIGGMHFAASALGAMAGGILMRKMELEDFVWGGAVIGSALALATTCGVVNGWLGSDMIGMLPILILPQIAFATLDGRS